MKISSRRWLRCCWREVLCWTWWSQTRKSDWGCEGQVSGACSLICVGRKELCTSRSTKYVLAWAVSAGFPSLALFWSFLYGSDHQNHQMMFFSLMAKKQWICLHVYSCRSEWNDAGKNSDIRYSQFNCSLHPLAKMSFPSLCNHVNLILEYLSIFIGCCFTESASCTKLNNSELLEQNRMRSRRWQSTPYCIINTMEPFSVHFTTKLSCKQERYTVL